MERGAPAEEIRIREERAACAPLGTGEVIAIYLLSIFDTSDAVGNRRKFRGAFGLRGGQADGSA